MMNESIRTCFWPARVAAMTATLLAAALCASSAHAKSVEEAFSELTEALLHHEALEVRETAAHALGGIGGPDAYSALEAAGFLDWPMWRYDAARTSNTPLPLGDELHLQWVRELPEPVRAWPMQWDDRGKLDFDVSYSPVVKGDQIFVPSNATDSVTAYGIADGEERWRFHANGPVRLAPVAWEDKVYFVSDDGYLYCLDAETGGELWRFRGGPTEQRLLGNERIVNLWPARGGPVVKDGVVYFAAGFWPMHGVFVYALDAESGDVEWVNDTTSSDYVALPHGGAYGYGGLAPQGYIAASEDELMVAGGRSMPAVLDRSTGEVLQAAFRAKPDGGYAVHAGGLGHMRNEGLAERVEELADHIDGEVFNKLAAHGRLFVTTTDGALYCFGPEETEPVRHEFDPAPLTPETDQWAQKAEELVEALGEEAGYALMLGAGSGDLLKELIARTELHIVTVERDADRVRALRGELAEAGMYGRRAAVIEADPAAFEVQPYLFSMVASEDAVAAGLPAESAALSDALDRLRPYGGVAYLGGSGDALDALADAAAAAGVDQVTPEARDDHLFAQRGGPLTGAGEWGHQHRDPGNTLMSEDERVRLPLGLLWYGGPNNHNILPRHSGGPRPHVVRGRIVYLGVENVAARCVYTGRQLWDQPFPGIGHPFTNMELEERWRDGAEVYMTNIPGATYIGSPIVTLPDSVYLRYEGEIFRLDPVTGETMDVFALPGRPVTEVYEDEDAPDWGHISLQGDYIITTAEPHIFEDQALGWTDSYSGTSSRLLVVMDRHSGEVLWQREANIGFRHNAIVSTDGAVYVIDGLSENAVSHLARRGEEPEEVSELLALNPETGEEIWRRDENIFGTFLLYSQAHDILVEGGSQDLRRTLDDEPRQMAAWRGSDGELLWERGGSFTLPGAVHGDMLVPGRPASAASIVTGEDWMREQPYTGESSVWEYSRTYGCNTVSASPALLFYRSGSAGFFDMEHDSGTGTFSGFRSGCTSNLVAADGVLSALDYTRTCTCSYQNQTSLAMIHMPGDTNVELWTRYDAATPNPEHYGVNFGAPGRRVDHASGAVWYDRDGAHRRHPSAITYNGGALNWVASSAREVNGDDEPIELYDLLEGAYTVRLHFAELDQSVEPGERVFDVLIDGEEVLTGFDIAEAAGGCLRGVVQELSIDLGMIMTLELRPHEESERDPLINGIELIASDMALAAAAN